MSWEHLHIISHSFPIVLTVSGAVVGLIGWWQDRQALEMWGLVSFIIAAAFVAPAYLTGLAAADVIADRTFVRPSVVQTHRFWATWAAIPVFSAGALAVFSFYERNDRRLRHFVLLVGLFASFVVAYAAWLGSKIEHGDHDQTSSNSGCPRTFDRAACEFVYSTASVVHTIGNRLGDQV